MKTTFSILVLLSFTLTSSAVDTRHADLHLTRDTEYIKITIESSDLEDTDTLILWFYSNFWPVKDKIPKFYLRSTMKADRTFHFKIPVNTENGYFIIAKIIPINESASFTDNEKAIIPSTFCWEKNDDVKIKLNLQTKAQELWDYNKYKMVFSGKGSQKYVIKALADSIYWSTPSLVLHQSNGNYTFYNPNDPAIRAAIRVLDQYRNLLTPLAYYVLKSDYLFQGSHGSFIGVKGYFMDSILIASSEIRQTFVKSTIRQIDTRINTCGISPLYLSKSKEAANYVIESLMTKFAMNQGLNDSREHNLDSIYYFIKRLFVGEWRDKLITVLLLNFAAPEDINSLLKDALRTVKTPDYFAMIKSYSNMISKGKTGYNFSLPDKTGKLYTFSKFKGKVVVLDFWFTGCGGCSGFYKNVLADIENVYKHDTDLVFISISIDPFKDHWIKDGLNSGKYTGSESINLYTNGEGASHPIIAHYNIQTFPTVILLDKNSRVVKFNLANLYSKESLMELINIQKRT